MNEVEMSKSMTDDFLKELYLTAYNCPPMGVAKHLAGLRAVRDHYADAAVRDFARPEEAKVRELADLIKQGAKLQVEMAHSIKNDALDAARYRWLRNPDNIDGPRYLSLYAPEQLDDEIDRHLERVPQPRTDAPQQEKP